MIGPSFSRTSWTVRSSKDFPSFFAVWYRMYAFVITISAPNFSAMSAGGIRILFGFTTGIRVGVWTTPCRVSGMPRRWRPSPPGLLPTVRVLKTTFIHIPWVGYPTEARLWREGFRTWDDFLDGEPRLRAGRERARAIRAEVERSRSRLEHGDYRYFARRLSPRDQWRGPGGWGDRATYLG